MFLNSKTVNIYEFRISWYIIPFSVPFHSGGGRDLTLSEMHNNNTNIPWVYNSAVLSEDRYSTCAVDLIPISLNSNNMTGI